MSERDEARRRQRCRTLVAAAALGVLLVGFSLVERAWVSVVVGVVGTAVVLVLYWRECWRAGSSATGSRDS